MADSAEQKPFRFVGIQDDEQFLVTGIDSEKYFSVRKSKFQTNFSEGKVDFHCNFEPWISAEIQVDLRTIPFEILRGGRTGKKFGRPPHILFFFARMPAPYIFFCERPPHIFEHSKNSCQQMSEALL